jgi:putative methyltransferase (TIGR04325 family)
VIAGGVSTVLDVGGGGGDNYLMIRPYLSSRRAISWVVSDNAALWDATTDERDQFIAAGDTLSRVEHLADHDADAGLLVLNGTLQYLPSLEWLTLQLAQRPKAIVVNRTVLSGEPTRTVRQEAVLGVGQAQQTFHVSNTVHNEQDLVLGFLEQGYVVQARSAPLSYALATDQGPVMGYYRTLTFLDSERTRR